MPAIAKSHQREVQTLPILLTGCQSESPVFHTGKVLHCSLSPEVPLTEVGGSFQSHREKVCIFCHIKIDPAGLRH